MNRRQRVQEHPGSAAAHRRLGRDEPDVEITAHGWVTKPGRRVAFAEADVRNPSGVVLASASSICLVMGPGQ